MLYRYAYNSLINSILPPPVNACLQKDGLGIKSPYPSTSFQNFVQFTIYNVQCTMYNVYYSLFPNP